MKTTTVMVISVMVWGCGSSSPAPVVSGDAGNDVSMMAADSGTTNALVAICRAGRTLRCSGIPANCEADAEMSWNGVPAACRSQRDALGRCMLAALPMITCTTLDNDLRSICTAEGAAFRNCQKGDAGSSFMSDVGPIDDLEAPPDI